MNDENFIVTLPDNRKMIKAEKVSFFTCGSWYELSTLKKGLEYCIGAALQKIEDDGEPEEKYFNGVRLCVDTLSSLTDYMASYLARRCHTLEDYLGLSQCEDIDD